MKNCSVCSDYERQLVRFRIGQNLRNKGEVSREMRQRPRGRETP
jgi:hypothetical protein